MIIVYLAIGLVVVGLISFVVIDYIFFEKKKSMPKPCRFIPLPSMNLPSKIELDSKRDGDQYFISLTRGGQSIDYDLGLRKTDSPIRYMINFIVSQNLPIGYVLTNDFYWHIRLFKIEFPPQDAPLENFKIEEVLDSATTEVPLISKMSEEQLKTFSEKSLAAARERTEPTIHFDNIYDVSPDGNYLLVNSCEERFADNNGDLAIYYDWMLMVYDVRNKRLQRIYPG